MAVFQRFFARAMKIGPVERQSIVTLATLLAITAIGYLSTIYFAHVLGPAILGSYFLFLAYYGVFELVGDSGFGGAAVKRISEGNEQGSFYSAYIFMRLILLVVLTVAILIAAPYLVDLGNSGLVYWLILALAVGTASGIVITGVYGTAKVGVSQISGLLNTVVKIAVQVVATFLGYMTAGLVGGFLAGLVIGTIVNFRFLDLKLTRFNFDHVKRLFSFSFWSFLTSSGSLAFGYADTILIGYFMTNADVGIYRVALQLSSVSVFIMLSLHPVLYPRISRWHATGELTSISNAISRAFTFSLILAVPVTVGGFFLSDRLLYFLYGAAFESGSLALVFLLLMQLVNVFMDLQTMCLIGMDQPRTSFLITGVTALLNIILNILLIPVFGITGAAAATLLAMAINAVFAFHYLRKFIPVKLEIRPVFSILKASVVMGVIVLGIRLVIPLDNVMVLVIAIALGAAAYFLIFLRLEKSIRNELREILLTMGVPWPSFI